MNPGLSERREHLKAGITDRMQDVYINMTESAAKYIKTIYILRKQTDSVHSVHIAKELGVTKASVSIAMSNLRREGMIMMKENGEIMLTSKGDQTAKELYERHMLLSDFLKKVAGVDEATALRDADKMERFVSLSTYEGIKEFTKRYQGFCVATQ